MQEYNNILPDYVEHERQGQFADLDFICEQKYGTTACPVVSVPQPPLIVAHHTDVLISYLMYMYITLHSYITTYTEANTPLLLLWLMKRVGGWCVISWSCSQNLDSIVSIQRRLIILYKFSTSGE